MTGDVLSHTLGGKNGRHGVIGQHRQSVFGRLGGYDDVNDADRLGRVVAKVEWHPGEFYPRVGLDPFYGSSVTNLSRPAERVVTLRTWSARQSQVIPKGVELDSSPFGKRDRAPALMPESLLRQ